MQHQCQISRSAWKSEVPLNDPYLLALCTRTKPSSSKFLLKTVLHYHFLGYSSYDCCALPGWWKIPIPSFLGSSAQIFLSWPCQTPCFGQMGCLAQLAEPEQKGQSPMLFWQGSRASLLPTVLLAEAAAWQWLMLAQATTTLLITFPGTYTSLVPLARRVLFCF